MKILGLAAFFLFSIMYASSALISTEYYGTEMADDIYSYVAGGVQGAPAIGSQYWRDPGAFSDGFRGVATVFVFCSTFYSGVKSIAVAATETKNPGTAVPLAIRQVIWRILVSFPALGRSWR